MRRFPNIVAAVLASALPCAAQEAEDIRGPKPPVEIPPPPPETPWGIWIAAAVLALLCAGMLVWWLRRRKPAAATPEEIARRELSRLRAGGDLMDAGEFAAAVSGVLRSFIERRFGIAAPKRTTEEFLHEVLAGTHGLADRIDALRAFLRACDAAKFGGGGLDKLEREDLLLKARGFVNEPMATREGAP